MESITMKVDENIIKQAVQSQMTAAIAAELSKISPNIIDGIVSGVLKQTVGDDGKNSLYSKQTLLQWLVNDAIKEAAREAIKEWTESEKPNIVKALKKDIQLKSGNLAEIFTDGLLESLKTSWRISVSLSDPK